MLASSVAREAEHLPIAPLELTTLAFAFCGLLTFAFAFHKPLDIFCALELRAAVPPEVLAELERVAVERGYKGGLYQHARNSQWLWQAWRSGWLLLIGTSIFNLIHVLGWNFVFPTWSEMTIWRISSVVALGSGIILLLDRTGRGYGARWEWTQMVPRLVVMAWDGVMICFFVSYLVSRFFLIVLPFTSLRAMDPKVYSPIVWSELIPHVH